MTEAPGSPKEASTAGDGEGSSMFPSQPPHEADTAAECAPGAVMSPITPNPWSEWRTATPARLALGRAGAGMPTDETLRFGWAHAMARDAIHAALDVAALQAQLQAQGWSVERVHSQAADRTTYLRRPDLGRQLAEDDGARLRAVATALHGAAPVDVCLVIGDGLSSLAVQRHAAPLLAALRPHLPATTRFAPVVIASQARVALADEVAEAFGATLAVMLIGERPGLSSPDSLGIYLTHAPRRGRHDAERNCISNVRPEGLPYGVAAFKLAWLMREALRRGTTGIALKDESDLAILESDGRAASGTIGASGASAAVNASVAGSAAGDNRSG
jgi:ethanolamine ammonia-lyase small subunit